MAASVRMSEDEAWDVLTGSHTGILTTLRRDGAPVTLPVWFCVLDRHVYVASPVHTKKIARVRHDGRASFLVESGTRWAELCAVQLSGRAVIVDDEAVVAGVRALLDEKYGSYRTPRPEMPDETRARYEVDTAVIRLDHEERVLSWDNAKLGLA